MARLRTAEGLRIGAFAGAPVILDWSVALLVAYLLAIDISRNGIAGAPFAIAYAIALLVSILAHELAHAQVAAWFNLPSKAIVLTFFGGHVEFVRPPLKRWHDILVSAAGPLANLAIWAACQGAAPLLAGGGDSAPPDNPIPELAGGFLGDLALLNLLLGAFNLLPGYPLDGGRMAQAALSYVIPRAAARRVAAWGGLIIAIGVAIFGLSRGLLLSVGIAYLLARAAWTEIVVATRLLRAGLAPSQP